MKKTNILLSLLLISFSESNALDKTIFINNGPINNIKIAQQHTTSWINNFRQFRTAIYQADKNKVKSFIDFPLMNENNEIWYLISPEDGKLTDKIKPFTEKDFDKYFRKLFTKEFINCIQKIKTQQLYKTGYFETIELSDGKETTYKMYATVDKKKMALSLNLAFNTVVKSNNEEAEDVQESNILYYFKIKKNGELKFIQVRLAG